jgi:hypothetical protein
MDHELILRDWLETTFRDALLDDNRVMQAAYLLKVGHEKGDPPVEIVRRCIAGFVRELVAPGAMDDPQDTWLTRN